MHIVTFTHAVNGRFITSTLMICGRKRWSMINASREWSSVRLGRLVLALRLRAAFDDAAREADYSAAVARVAVDSDN